MGVHTGQEGVRLHTSISHLVDSVSVSFIELINPYYFEIYFNPLSGASVSAVWNR